MNKHNKKRNVGLIYEFLVRTIADALVEGDNQKREMALKILKTHFSKKSELYREFRLFHSLVNTTVGKQTVADAILEAARTASKKYDSKKLDHEKSLLIRSINHKLKDANFYNRRIDEYKIYATIQSLLNEWRSDNTLDIVQHAQYEEQLREWLLKEKEAKVVEEGQTDIDPLVEKIMLKKLNERYQGVLTEDQANIIKSYVFSQMSEDKNEIISCLKAVQAEAVQHIDDYLQTQSGKNTYLENKLRHAKQLILAEGVESVDDAVVEKFLDIAKLKYEIVTKE